MDVVKTEGACSPKCLYLGGAASSESTEIAAGLTVTSQFARL